MIRTHCRGITVASCAVLLAVLLGGQGCTSSKKPRDPISRGEFTKHVKGKTEEEVSAVLGKPARTSVDPMGQVVWEYDALTIDPETSERDNKASVAYSKKSKKGDTVSFSPSSRKQK